PATSRTSSSTPYGSPSNLSASGGTLRMGKYIVKRLLLMIPTLLGVAVLIFFLMRVVPGDIVELRFAGESAFASKENLDKERVRLGLDQPIWKQFLTWIAGIVRLDFGKSMWTGAPILEEIRLRLIWRALAVGYQYPKLATHMPQSAMRTVLRDEYSRTDRAKRLCDKLILSRHALKNAKLSVFTIIALEFAFIIGGLVVTVQ